MVMKKPMTKRPLQIALNDQQHKTLMFLERRSKAGDPSAGPKAAALLLEISQDHLSTANDYRQFAEQILNINSRTFSRSINAAQKPKWPDGSWRGQKLW